MLQVVHDPGLTESRKVLVCVLVLQFVHDPEEETKSWANIEAALLRVRRQELMHSVELLLLWSHSPDLGLKI